MVKPLPERADQVNRMASVLVTVVYHGKSHSKRLAISDEVSCAFIHSLLTEAVDKVRSSMNEDRDSDYPGQQRVADFPNELPEDGGDNLQGGLVTPLPPDAPSLPSPVAGDEPDTLLDTLAAIRTCRSVTLQSWVDRGGAHSRRVVCGHQLVRDELTQDLVCPNAANHVGGVAHVKGRHPGSVLRDDDDHNPFEE